MVDVALTTATASKMSYYLRYGSRSVDVVQRPGADLPPAARGSCRRRPATPRTSRPRSPGGGVVGIDPGTQSVHVQLYVPVGGTITDLR